MGIQVQRGQVEHTVKVKASSLVAKVINQVEGTNYLEIVTPFQ